MTDSELIDFCYRNILHRDPDDRGRLVYIEGLAGGRTTREDVFMSFLTSAEFQARMRCDEFVPPGHFYSATPSDTDRAKFLASEYLVDDIPAVRLNRPQQVALLHRFERYYRECPFPEEKTDGFRYYFINPSYSYMDAITLHSMIRHFQPRRIIEIGSGHSSCAMLDTIDRFLPHPVECTFIDPYPQLLESLLGPGDRNRTIIPKLLQDVDLGLFRTLGENDILFVDSTHVSKLQSDVNRVIFDLLPALNKGVLVHIHDILWPFEYSKKWIREGRAWNEAYILRAFLEYNNDFDIIFFSSFLHHYERAWLQEHMPRCVLNPGGNIWLRKGGN
ncbi:MAG: hypothetical protein QOE70_6478 [Chthoniobacter sp.]|jgi:hypothetical protein|nr:hypothetical protein [Chthoniobacter sp.]